MSAPVPGRCHVHGRLRTTAAIRTAATFCNATAVHTSCAERATAPARPYSRCPYPYPHPHPPGGTR